MQRGAYTKLRIAVGDIETTDLAAVGAGWVTCAVFQPLGSKRSNVYVWNPIKERAAHEKTLIESIYKEISQYDLIVGHNFVNFDWMYLKSRAIILEVARPNPPLCYDTMWAAKRVGIKTSINTWTGKSTVALDHIIDFYGIPQLKTKIYPRRSWDLIWEHGFKKGIAALKEKVEHCVDDVKMTEVIYWKLLRDDPKPKIERLST